MKPIICIKSRFLGKKNIKKYWDNNVNILLYYRLKFLSYNIFFSLFKKSLKTFLLFCYVGYKGNSLNYSFFLFYPENHKNLAFRPKQAQNKFETVQASIKHINFNHWSRDHTCLIDKTNKNQSHMTDKLLLLSINAWRAFPLTIFSNRQSSDPTIRQSMVFKLDTTKISILSKRKRKTWTKSYHGQTVVKMSNRQKWRYDIMYEKKHQINWLNNNGQHLDGESDVERISSQNKQEVE